MPESHISNVEKLMTPCLDKEHLRLWINKYTNLDFPHKTISRFSNSNPLDFIWECYSAIIEGRSLGVLGLAGRDSFKTLGLSVLDLMAFLHDGRDVVHVAMTTQQGSRARNYLEKFVTREPLLSSAVVKMNTKEIRLKIDSTLVGMELLPATPKAVQGAHCGLLTFDEVASSMEPKNLQAYKDAHGILGSHRGKPAVVVKITSRQQGFSLAEQEIRNAGKSGLKILRWTTLDATERCPEERSGTVSTPLWVDPLSGEKYLENEFLRLPEAKKPNFQKTEDTFDKCRECPIAAFCCGDLKKQVSNSPLLRTIDDVINKIRLSGSWDWGVAQIMSMKPSSEGLIFFEYKHELHVPGWNQMWKTLTGQEPNFEVSRDLFTQELKKRGAVFYAGIDWGWSSPSTCVVMAVDSSERCYVMEALGRTFTNDPDFIELIRTTLHKKYDIQKYCPDIANGSGADLLIQAGLPTTKDIDKRINFGINLVKGLFRVPGTNDQSRILFAPDLQSTVIGVEGIMEEIDLYHKQMDATGKILDDADPEDKYNHYIDALRYMVYWLFGRGRAQLGIIEEKQRVDAEGKPTNIPSHSELLNTHGITFIDNRDGTEPAAPPKPGETEPTGPLWSWT
jgi:hypothetical protein